MRIITKDTNIKYNNLTEKYPEINLEQSIFFDIETTGFSSKSSKLYMIGCLYINTKTETFHTTQWFLDDYKDEAALILSFIEFSKSYSTLIHYNGLGFDIPYMEDKCIKYNIIFDFMHFKHIDLYKCVSKIKNLFKIENLKQKTMEQFFSLNREDIFSGGDLISVYSEYMQSKNEHSMNLLLLHNYEDIQGMLTLLDILSYTYIFNEKYVLKTLSINDYISRDEIPKKEVIIELQLDTPIPKRVSLGTNEFYMTAFNDKLRIKIEVYTEELKFFYPNYKDYYYLPEEDMSIHKSVAFYVDKNFRVKAKAANCYSKKTGKFLPQYAEVVTPYFKKEYNDKETYFEVTDEFLANGELILNYVAHVLKFINNAK